MPHIIIPSFCFSCDTEDNVISIHEFEALHVRWKYGEMDAGTSERDAGTSSEEED